MKWEIIWGMNRNDCFWRCVAYIDSKVVYFCESSAASYFGCLLTALILISFSMQSNIIDYKDNTENSLVAITAGALTFNICL